MVGNDDMVGEPGGGTLQPPEQGDIKGLLPPTELTGVEFGDNVVDIENDLGASQLRIPPRKDEEVGHVVYVEQVIGLAGMLAGNPERRGNQETQDRD